MSLRDKFRTWRDRDKSPSKDRGSGANPSTTQVGSSDGNPKKPDQQGLTIDGNQAQPQVESSLPQIDGAIPCTRDLWQEAFECLQGDSNTRRLLSAYRRFIIDNAMSHPNEQRPDGSDLSVQTWRKILGRSSSHAAIAMSRTGSGPLLKAVNLISEANAALEFAASFEPHAAIAWSGLSIILPLVTRVLSAGPDAASGLEEIAEIMILYAQHEKTYRTRTAYARETEQCVSGVLIQLEQHIINVYKMILEYQLHMACHFGRSTFVRYARNVALRDDWQSILASIKDSSSRAREDMLAIDSSRLKDLLEEMKALAESQIRMALACDFLSGKNSRHPSPTPGTCEWFTQTDRYSECILEGSNPFIFITAGPGCGKSVLMKYLVDHKFIQMNMTYCYFFFGALGAQTDTPATALKAILYQLHTNHTGSLTVEEHLGAMKVIEASWKTHGPVLTQNMDLMFLTITKVSKLLQRGLMLVIDGLDEAHDPGLFHFMELVNQHFATSSSTLRLIIAARPYFDAKYRFSTLIRGTSEAQLNIDVYDISNDTLLLLESRVAKLDLSARSRTHLIQAIIKKQGPSRSFLWLRVVLDYLEFDPVMEQAGERQIDNVIDRVPDELDKIYEKMLDRTSNRGEARLLLHIVLAAQEPISERMTKLAMISAVHTCFGRECKSFTLDQTDNTFAKIVNNLCGLLLTVSQGKVYLFHETVRDFLQVSNQSRLLQPKLSEYWKSSFWMEDSHTVLSLICVDRLAQKSFVAAVTETTATVYDPLTSYACKYWLTHRSNDVKSRGHHGTMTTSFGSSGTFFPKQPSFPNVTNLTDLSKPWFWFWYANSGVTKEQLRSDWTVWLMLLASESNIVSFIPDVLDLMLCKENEVQLQCHGRIVPVCGHAAEFICTSRSMFEIHFRLNTGVDYNQWRKEQETEKVSKKPPILMHDEEAMTDQQRLNWRLEQKARAFEQAYVEQPKASMAEEAISRAAERQESPSFSGDSAEDMRMIRGGLAVTPTTDKPTLADVGGILSHGHDTEPSGSASASTLQGTKAQHGPPIYGDLFASDGLAEYFARLADVSELDDEEDAKGKQRGT